MTKQTKDFVIGKITLLRQGISSIVGIYKIDPAFDKNLNEAIYAINRATVVLINAEESQCKG